MSDEKVYMLNALWFKADGGRETYKEYVKLASPFIAAVGGKKIESYQPDKALIGEFDADLVFFVEYPSWTAFKEFVGNQDYQQNAVPIREKALANSLLIRCSKTI